MRAASDKAGLKEVTFFEFTTAMAFLYFRKKKVDFAVVETGMGGRLDATNLLRPRVSVITNIDLDHTAWLGSTIRQIAAEKAGKIKPGVPVVTGVAQKEALSVIRVKAKEASSPLYLMGSDFHASLSERGSLDYSGTSGGLTGLKLALYGPHQMKNAALALAAIEVMRSQGADIREKAIRAGLKKASWPGRFEILSRKPLIVLDGAHNPSGAAALKSALSGLKKKKLILVVGIMSDKEIDGILKEIVPSCDLVIATVPRYGGEELVLLLAEADLDAAHRVMERIRSGLATTPIGLAGGGSFTVSVSIGLAEYRDGESIDDLLRRADATLYEATRSGRDRVVIAA